MDDKYKDLMRFISGYESPESPQSVDEIKGDFQLAGLMTALNKVVSGTPTPLLIDLGCGNGVLFAKLAKIDCFNKYPALFYEGFDSAPSLTRAFENAANLNLLPKVRLFPLDKDWTTHVKEPCVVIIRNVLHELTIPDASDLLYSLCTSLPEGAIFFLQDMSTLPIAEKGRCGWMGIHIEAILQACGMKTILTPDTSKRGVDIYLIEGRRQEVCKTTEITIKDMLLSARNEQLKILQLKYNQLKEHPENTLSILRLNHDIAAISLQLGLLADSKNDEEIISSTFALAFKTLSITDFNNLRLNFKYPQIKWFQDRGHAIQAIDDFLLADKYILLVIGPNYIGKKTAVWHALDKKQHSRLPLFVELFTGITIFNILETLAAQLGLARFIDVEIIAALKSYPVEKLFIAVKAIVNTLAMNTILILDSFESIVDPESTINNKDVNALLDLWSSIEGAKIIIESRVNIKGLPIEKYQSEYVSVFKSRSDSSRFGTFLYSVQLLQEIVPSEYRILNSEFGGFPYDLLVTVENHPYFLYIAGTAIRNNTDTNCLSNPVFLNSLKVKLADTLFSTFNFAENERELLYSLTLITDGFPLRLIDIVSGSSSLSNKLLTTGSILEVAPDVYKALGILRFINIAAREQYKENAKEKKWNKLFHHAFQQLYQTTSNPSYYRQAHYHAVLAGEPLAISAYNIAEISKCTETWYQGKHLRDALWGYQEIKKHRQLTAKEAMREAACLTRTGFHEKGKAAYSELINQHPYWSGLRNSLIDSLIATGECARDALDQLSVVAHDKRDYYWHRQSARCYRQLGRRSYSYDEYEKAILSAPLHLAHPIIREIIIYAREISDYEVIKEWAEYSNRILKISAD